MLMLITHMITDRIGLHLVLVPFLIASKYIFPFNFGLKSRRGKCHLSPLAGPVYSSYFHFPYVHVLVLHLGHSALLQNRVLEILARENYIREN